MAETITYPESGYGIMPTDAFNKYLRWSNQRRATTGISAPYSDRKAFWEGTMDSAAKNASTRAMQNLENKKYQSNVAFQNRQLDMQEDASKRSALSGLAQIPMTYLMYDALGIGREKGPAEDSWLKILGKGIKKLYNGEEAIPQTDYVSNWGTGTPGGFGGNVSPVMGTGGHSTYNFTPGVTYDALGLGDLGNISQGANMAELSMADYSTDMNQGATFATNEANALDVNNFYEPQVSDVESVGGVEGLGGTEDFFPDWEDFGSW